jgi:uncharacterized NAD(P)/FAD-binding protein YdhS
MITLSGRVLELVCKLDAMGPAPTLVELSEALEAAGLTRADVDSFVETNPRNYNRALVAWREQYELLVMTWLPGQASVPHDHAGSICAMQVVEGDAIEGSYRVADDGYVELDYETTVRCGEVTAGQDAGVHTVRHAADAGGLLVTVHVYAPPLKDFRRFVPRPESTTNVPERAAGADVPTVVVVGGGFSGSMTAAQVLRKMQSAGIHGRVVIVERRGAVGEGVAYGTRELAHLLNVPADRMSAWPDRPDDFVRWASARRRNVRPGEFLPRQWYGEYVRETLLGTAKEVGAAAELSVLLDEVRRVARRPEGGWLVHLARGASIRADAVVLAIGHRPPDDPIGRKWSGPRTRYIIDPWRPFALNVIGPNDSVIVLGSGLSAVDAVLSLAHPSRTAPITILSRRGLLPQAHTNAPLTSVDVQPLVSGLMAAPGGVRALNLCRKVRQMAREQATRGVDWRSVVDGLRPHTAKLWQAMSLGERKRFVRHMRPFWEVHRHRMALAIAEQFGEMHDCDRVSAMAGRVQSAQGDAKGVQLIVDARENNGRVKIDADWVVNCTGPAPSNSAASNPAIGSLLVDGWLRPDELSLGIETAAHGNAIARDGKELADLLLVGTLRKPALWESTAVPELRGQAAVVADRIVMQLMRQSLATSGSGVGAKAAQ